VLTDMLMSLDTKICFITKNSFNALKLPINLCNIFRCKTIKFYRYFFMKHSPFQCYTMTQQWLQHDGNNLTACWYSSALLLSERSDRERDRQTGRNTNSILS
jgi:hypothetical protein